MVMKPVRLLCYMFLWTWKCTTFKRIPIILIVLTNKNVALIYSVTICQQKTKDCALSRCFEHKLQHCCFYHWCLLLFITSPLITMLKPNQKTRAKSLWGQLLLEIAKLRCFYITNDTVIEQNRHSFPKSLCLFLPPPSPFDVCRAGWW